MTPRTIILIALFHLALGAGLLGTYFLDSANSLFYDRPVISSCRDECVYMKKNGLNENGAFEYIPYNYDDCPDIPLVSMHREKAEEAFVTIPPEPMDWAVLLFQLHKHKVDNIYISAPLAWKNSSNILITQSLTDRFSGFKNAVIGKPLILSSRASGMPEGWAKLALKENQYAGETAKLVLANKLYGDDEIRFSNSITAPSRVDNDDLFRPNPDEHISPPLFIKWGDEILPTSPLVIALAAMGMETDDIHVHFGDKLRLGDRVSIPIDEAGRISLRSDASVIPLGPADIIVIPDNPALSQRQEPTIELLGKAPVVCISEPFSDSNEVSTLDVFEAKTISSLLAGISPQTPIILHKLQGPLIWLFLIVMVAAGLWALRYTTSTRWLAFTLSFALIWLLAILFYNLKGVWIPIWGLIASWLFICLASFFISPTKADQEDNTEHDEKEDSQKPSIPVESVNFTEPNKIPIPKPSKKEGGK